MKIILEQIQKDYYPVIEEVFKELKKTVVIENGCIMFDTLNFDQLFMIGMACGHLEAQKSFAQDMSNGVDRIVKLISPSNN